MCKIINFPVPRWPEPTKQPELPPNDIDYEMIYAENEDYICKGKCYRCEKVFSEDDHIWSINQRGGWPSRLDDSQIDIEICDDCMVSWLHDGVST